ncbi:MAG TPA: hypothetical protein VGJ98_03800, partial [Candidatus Eisenbacteria bacterium]
MSGPSPASGQSYSVTGAQTFQTLLPGQGNAQCFTLTITNTLVPLTLQSVRFTNKTLGAPGTPQAQLDAELGQPRLYLDRDGSATFQPGADSPSLSQATASGGILLFSGLSVAVPALGTVRLFVVTDIPTAVRDGDNLDLSIQAASDLTFNAGVATNA